MKVRYGFVTNSSSSSFLIGKKDATFTIDEIFVFIRDNYKELLQKSKEMLDYCNEKNKDGKNIYPVISKYGFFSYEHGVNFRTMTREERDKIFKREDAITTELTNLFGIDPFDAIFTKEPEWFKYDTYADYEKFYIEKLKVDGKKDSSSRAPFTIAPTTNLMPIFIHYKDIEPAKENNYTVNGVIEWYYDEDDDYEDLSVCVSDCSKLDNNKKVELFAALGDICVYSECGYIPEHVVKKLNEISNYCCNHMG